MESERDRRESNKSMDVQLILDLEILIVQLFFAATIFDIVQCPKPSNEPSPILYGIHTYMEQILFI